MALLSAKNILKNLQKAIKVINQFIKVAECNQCRKKYFCLYTSNEQFEIKMYERVSLQ